MGPGPYEYDGDSLTAEDKPPPCRTICVYSSASKKYRREKKSAKKRTSSL